MPNGKGAIVREKIKQLYTVERLSPQQICAQLGLSLQHVCNVITHKFEAVPPHGITKQKYEQMLANGCAICGKITTNLVVDHNHQTNQVRDILCYSCNVALGKFKESPELLTRAIRYLEWHLASSNR